MVRQSHPFSEEGDRLYGATSKIRWSYAVCKTLEETLCLGYGLDGLPVTIVRCLCYGPRAKDGPYAGVTRDLSAQHCKGKTFSYMEMENRHVVLRM